MKKIFSFVSCFILLIGLSMCFVGCGDTRSKFIFYNPDGSVFEELMIDEGTKPRDVNYRNYTTYLNYNYTFKGWYGFINGDMSLMQDYDISKENYNIGTNSTYSYVALLEIKQDGWNYSGDNQNAFVWEEGTYASPAIKLFSGDNYIRFDKKTTTEALKYCEVFVNGGNGNYISSVELYDDRGFPLQDVDLSNNIWETSVYNPDQYANKVSSYIIKISVTKNFEAGIMIGSDIN